MRAPPLARMADVAAPRPDAEPVTVTHKPSFDIRVSSYRFRAPGGAPSSYRAGKTHANPPNLRCAELIIPRLPFMSPLQAALRRQALVMAMAFPHHPVQEKQEKIASDAGAEWPGEIRCQMKTGNAVVESENIVAETAEKIFSDLADAQTINRDQKGDWKAPLWQALTEAGLPLSWVPEDCDGSGASLAEGFSVLMAAGRFAIAVPLAETMLAGWLLSQSKIASPVGMMTIAPASPKDRIAQNADGTLSGRARGVPFARDAQHIA